MVSTPRQSARADSPIRYGSVSRLLHWGMAVLIGWQALKIFDRIDEGEHWIGQTLVPAHVTVGTVLLMLIVLRIVWASQQRGNRPKLDPPLATPAKVGHVLLYAGMALLPVTGILTLIGGGHGWTAFGIRLVAKGDEIPWMSSLGSMHSPIAWMLLVMIVGHIAMAVFHHVVRKDEILRRMI